jgi:hypothetical protein
VVAWSGDQATTLRFAALDGHLSRRGRVVEVRVLRSFVRTAICNVRRGWKLLKLNALDVAGDPRGRSGVQEACVFKKSLQRETLQAVD